VGKVCGRCIRDLQACISPEGEFSSLCGDPPLTDSQVVLVTSESKRRAAAKAEKEKKAKAKAKAKAKEATKLKKVAPPVAESSNPSKVPLRKSLLFSSRIIFG
jgi:hypothetical protein